MDATPLLDPQYLPVILATLVGFGILAAALLVPVSRFLDREQQVAEKWTPDVLAEHMHEKKVGENGRGGDEPSDESSPSGS